MVGNPKMDPSHIKTSCGTKQNSNPLRTGLGFDYVTLWEILKRMAPTSKLHVGHKKKIPILWTYGWELTMSHGGKS